MKLVFGQDLDGDSAIGLNLSNLDSVDTDTYSDVLKKNSVVISIFLQKQETISL